MQDFNVAEYFRNKLLEQEDVLDPKDIEDETPEIDDEDDFDETELKKIEENRPEVEKILVEIIKETDEANLWDEGINRGKFLGILKDLKSDKIQYEFYLLYETPQRCVEMIMDYVCIEYLKQLIKEKQFTQLRQFDRYILLFDRIFYDYIGRDDLRDFFKHRPALIKKLSNG